MGFGHASKSADFALDPASPPIAAVALECSTRSSPLPLFYLPANCLPFNYHSGHPDPVEGWSRLRDSNSGPSLYESAALPTELRRRQATADGRKCYSTD